MRNRKGWILLAVFIMMITTVGCFAGEAGEHESTNGKEPVIETIDLNLLCVGDIMAHGTQIKAQHDEITDTYDFNNNFSYIKKYVEEADIAMCNVETVFADKPYSGYPLFNAPESLASAINAAGFDVALTSNNHILDQGEAGFMRSVDVLRENGLTVVGTRKEGEKRFSVIEAKGVKVGIVAYTYETPSIGGGKSLNGNPVPSSVSDLLASFDPANLETDMKQIIEDINAAKDEGADILVCYLHWGDEYHTEPNDYQKRMVSELLASTGVDVIFASHPHVIQPMSIINNEAQQKNVAVYYSMGNFLSNQRDETLGNRLTEDGLMARTKFEITKTDGVITSIELNQVNAMPTWVNRYKSGEKWVYEIIPLDDEIETNPSLIASGNVNKAQRALTDVKKILGIESAIDDAAGISIFEGQDTTEGVDSEWPVIE